MAWFKVDHRRNASGKLCIMMPESCWIYEYMDPLYYRFRRGIAETLTMIFRSFLSVVESVEQGWRVTAVGPRHSLNLTRYFLGESEACGKATEARYIPFFTLDPQVEERFKRCKTVTESPREPNSFLLQAIRAWIRIYSLANMGWEVVLIKEGEEPVRILSGDLQVDPYRARNWRWKDPEGGPKPIVIPLEGTPAEMIKKIEEVLGAPLPESKPKPEPTKH